MNNLDRVLGARARAAVAVAAVISAACTGTIGPGSGPGSSPGIGSSTTPGSRPGAGSPAGGAASPSQPAAPGGASPPARPGDPPPPAGARPCHSPISLGFRTVRLLTREQYQNAVKDLLGVDFDVTKELPPDTASGSFTNNNDLSVLEGAFVSYVQTAEKIAAWSAQRNFAPALGCGSVDQACAQRLVDELGFRVFRRPLTADEKQSYLDVAKGSASGGDVKKGIEIALAAMLSAPQFIYRHELGEPSPARGADVYELTPYELATFLAFTFNGSTPDKDLLDAARNNALGAPEQIERQAARLLAGARAIALVRELVHRWLGTENLEIYTKDATLFPGFAQLVAPMKAELSELFSHVMLQSAESFRSLYDPGYTFANAALARHYGLSSVSGDSAQKVATTARGGLLLSGAFLSKWGQPKETNPVTRAVHVRRDLLCQDVPDPPPNVNISREGKADHLEAFLAAPTTTNRMAFHRLTEDGPCQACHAQVINPLGFGLEDFDTVGRIRTMDSKGNAIDASGALWSPAPQLALAQDPANRDARVEFQGGKGLARLLVEDPRVSSLAKACLAKQVMSFATGLDARSLDDSQRKGVVALSPEEKDGYSCDVGRMVQLLSTASPRGMLEKLTTLSSVRYRKAWGR